jgi:hypothetical protein
MEFKMAAFSANVAIASTAQSVASGIEIAAAKPGGLGSISDSFQNTPTSTTSLQPAGQFAPSAAMEIPNQYFTRLNDFHRDASGLVSSSDLAKNLADPNMDVMKEVGSFYKELQSRQSELEKMTKDAQGVSDANQDRMGNFEIQLLMDEMNQSETLASSVAKKRDDVKKAIDQKI